jgi:hypothetical protein
MATLLRKILPISFSKKRIFFSGGGASGCCTSTCEKDYVANFRSDVVLDDPIPTISEITGIAINGISRTFPAPISISTDADLKAIIAQIRLSFFILGYSGDSIEICCYDDDTFELKILNCEAVINKIFTDAADIDMNRVEDGSESLCNCGSVEPEGVSSPPSGDGCVICSEFPPVYTDVLWRNDNDGLTYFYDGVDWVTTAQDDFQYSDSGNWGNNEFLDFGNHKTTTTLGPLAPHKLKISKITLIGATSAGNIRLYSNAAIIANVAFTSALKQVIIPATVIEVVQGENLSVQKTSGTASNVFCVIYFRKVY